MRIWALAISVVVALLALIVPRALTGTNRVWSAAAHAIATFVNIVVLGLLFYAVFAPIGTLRRLGGADALRLRRHRTSSHWVDREPRDATHFTQQF